VNIWKGYINNKNIYGVHFRREKERDHARGRKEGWA
jgi:hypothetical protein